MTHSLAKIHSACQGLTTPAYLFDIQAIKIRMTRLAQSASQYNIGILMSVKAFPHPEVLSLAADILQGFDVSNYNEFKLVQGIVSGDQIVSITGPDPHYDLFPGEHIPCSLIVNPQDELQLKKCRSLAGNGLLSIRLAHDDLVNEKTGFWGQQSRFGFPLSTIERALTDKVIKPEELAALHVHCGATEKNPELYLDMLRSILSFARKNGLTLQCINLGGGLLPLSFEQVEELFASVEELVGNRVKIFFEPGQFLDKNCGFVAAHIVSVSRKKMLDNGLAHYDILLNISSLCHLGWSGYRVHFFSKPMSNVDLTLYGPTCFERDEISRDILPLMRDGKLTVKAGDRVILSSVSGYSHAMQREFNGIEKLPLLFV